jgi:hypothetical protein
MPNPSTFDSLLGAVERYFDLMFDSADRASIKCFCRLTGVTSRSSFCIRRQGELKRSTGGCVGRGP